MRSHVHLAALVVLAWAMTRAHAIAADADGNGVDDAAEPLLARRFSPVLALHAPDAVVHGLRVPVYPVPVEIMGLATAVPGEGLPADRLFVMWNAEPLNYPYGDHWVRAAGWSPPLPESDPRRDYAGLADDPPERRQVAPPGMPSGPYTLRLHWEYGNPAVDEPEEWYDVWEHGNAWTRPGADFPPTAYAHLRRCEDAGCAPPGAVFIQYWFFFPFNDWVNNHEGDWEGLNAIASSDDPATAALVDVEYFAHKVRITRDPGTPLAEHCLVLEGTHAVAFIGGHGRVEGCIGGTGEGEGSHGFYPTAGRYEEVGEGDFLGCFERADEEVAVSAGPTIHWSDLAIQVLPDPSAIDTAAEPERAWLAADLLWGTRRVPSVGGALLEDAGNWAPHGPAHNPEGRWGRAAASTTTRPYSSAADPHPRPYRPAELGWVPLAFFLDRFSGMTAGEPGDLGAWTLGTGSWTLAGGALEGAGNGLASLSNRAAFSSPWPPGGATLPFVAWNPRAARVAADLVLAAPLAGSSAAGLIVAGALAGPQVRIALRREGSGHALEVRVRAPASDSLVASAPIADPGGAVHRLEVLTVAPDSASGLFHDVWYDGTLVLGSVATPGAREAARGLLADGLARVRFDRVSLAGLRLETEFRHPPFATFTAAPAAGADIYACPQMIAWTAIDEKSDSGIAAQELRLSTDGGTTWGVVAALGGAERSFAWLPPAVAAPRPAMLALGLVDVEGDAREIRGASFWLRPGPPPAAVLAPAGGETWIRSTTAGIRWTAPCRITVDLALSTDGGASFPHPIASGVPNAGLFPWAIPAALPVGSRCRIRIGGGELPAGVSAADFTLGWDGRLAGGDFEDAGPAGPWSIVVTGAEARGAAATAHGIGRPPLTPPLAGEASLFAHARAGGTAAAAPFPPPAWPARAALELTAGSERLPVETPPGDLALHFELHALAVVEAPAAASATVRLEVVYRDAAGRELAAAELAAATAERESPGAATTSREDIVPLDPPPPGAAGLGFRLRLEVSATAASPGARAEAQVAADGLRFEHAIAVASPPAVRPPAPALRVTPNPGTGAGPVAIAFDLAAAGPVSLALYDPRGRLVARLLDRAPLAAGRHVRRWDPAALPAGAYFFRLTAARKPPATVAWLVVR